MTTVSAQRCTAVPWGCEWPHEPAPNGTPRVHASAAVQIKSYDRSISLRLHQYEQQNGQLEDVRIELRIDDDVHTVTPGAAALIATLMTGIGLVAVDQVAAELSRLVARAGGAR